MSIALVVVALGILSVASIFPKQLESVEVQTRKMHMANFAQHVVDILTLMATDRSLLPGGVPISIQMPLQTEPGTSRPYSSWWVDPDDSSTTPGTPAFLVLDGSVRQIRYEQPTRDESNTIDPYRFDLALQYSGRITQVVPGVRWGLQLNLWPARQTPVAANAETFYTEIQTPGR